jgi:GNAT superfamily N-acetyltransferase
MARFQVIRAGVKHAELLESAIRDLHSKQNREPVAVEEFLEDPACISCLAVGRGNVVGSLYGYALRRPETRRPKFFLYEIDVAKSHRRFGIGRELMLQFLREARRQNAIGVWVQAKAEDTRTQTFYLACGGKADEDNDVLFSFAL